MPVLPDITIYCLKTNVTFYIFINQQSAEGGFKFLKDPWFMVDSFFVKKATQIGNQVQNPTLRWVFQIMKGIGIIQVGKNDMVGRARFELATN